MPLASLGRSPPRHRPLKKRPVSSRGTGGLSLEVFDLVLGRLQGPADQILELIVSEPVGLGASYSQLKQQDRLFRGFRTAHRSNSFTFSRVRVDVLLARGETVLLGL